MAQMTYQRLLADLKAVEEMDFRNDPDRAEAMASQLFAAVKMILVNLIDEFER
jgi:hypothetical protein